MIEMEYNLAGVFESLINGINEYLQSCVALFRPRMPSFLKRSEAAAGEKVFGKEYEALYFDSVERRIKEQDEEIVRSGQDYYVYD